MNRRFNWSTNWSDKARVSKIWEIGASIQDQRNIPKILMSHDPSHWMLRFVRYTLMLILHLVAIRMECSLVLSFWLSLEPVSSCHKQQGSVRRRKQNYMLTGWLWFYWLSGKSWDFAGDNINRTALIFTTKTSLKKDQLSLPKDPTNLCL